MSSETFEQVLTVAQSEGSFTPAWKKFVRTKFFVPIIRPEDEPKNFKLRMSDIMGDGKQTILISEVRERVEDHHGSSLAWLYGADVLRMLHAEASILVALNDRAFNIAKDKVEWLKKGLEASQAKAAAKSRLPASTPASAPAPAKAAPAAAPSPSPSLEPARRPGVFDIAAIKPRAVAMPKIGLEMFVPSGWRQSDTAKGLRFEDADTGIVVEASGFHRANVQLPQWLGMRLDLVRHEMRYLTQAGESYALDGEGWRDRVQGMATEFTGTFPGDAAESRFLVACVCVDGTLVSVTIKAPAATFELDRALFKWLLGRIDISETAAIVYGAPASGAAHHDDVGPVPAIFGMSTDGRLGRVRAMAYSFPIMLPMVLVAIVSALTGAGGILASGVLLAVVALVTVWFSMRLLVMRLHDVNLSGKWIFALIGISGLAGTTHNPMLISGAGALFWLVLMVVYFFLPGTDGENDYGLQTPPNSTLVTAGAALYVLLQLTILGLAFKGAGMMRAAPPPAAAVQQRDPNTVVFTTPDGTVSIDFPGAPTEVELPKIVRDSMGSVQMHQYKATAQGRTYMLQTVDYGKAPGGVHGTLESVGMSVVGRDGVQISEDRSLRYNGVEGREVRASAGGLVRSARFVIVGSRAYMALAITHDDPADMRRVDEFLGSFAPKITKIQ